MPESGLALLRAGAVAGADCVQVRPLCREPKQFAGARVELLDFVYVSVGSEPSLKVTDGLDAPGRVHRGRQVNDGQTLDRSALHVFALQVPDRERSVTERTAPCATLLAGTLGGLSREPIDLRGLAEIAEAVSCLAEHIRHVDEPRPFRLILVPDQREDAFGFGDDPEPT